MNDMDVPAIKIGSGTTKFYINICRAYLKNHTKIRIIGGGYKIGTALIMYQVLKKEFFVHDIQHLCVFYNRMHSMCTFLVSINTPTEIFSVAIADNENEIKITETDTVSYSTQLCRDKFKHALEIHLTAVGECCVKAFFVASQLALTGYFSFVYPIEMTDDNEIKIKIKLYKPF